MIEVVRRDREKRDIEKKRRNAERAKAREEEYERQRIEHQREIREIHREQKRILKQRYADPIWGRYTRALEEKEIARLSTHSNNYVAPAAGRMSPDLDDDPFIDNDIEPLNVFGKNNDRQSKKEPFSRDEKFIFVDIMRTNSGRSSKLLIALIS